MELIGIGIDLVEHHDFMNKDIKKLSSRILSEKELIIFNNYNSIEYLASRFACKEAIFKAFKMGDKTTFYKDISILNNPDGSPYVIFDKKNNYIYFISLSHTKNYSVANVMIFL